MAYKLDSTPLQSLRHDQGGIPSDLRVTIVEMPFGGRPSSARVRHPGSGTHRIHAHGAVAGNPGTPCSPHPAPTEGVRLWLSCCRRQCTFAAAVPASLLSSYSFCGGLFRLAGFLVLGRSLLLLLLGLVTLGRLDELHGLLLTETWKRHQFLHLSAGQFLRRGKTSLIQIVSGGIPDTWQGQERIIALFDRSLFLLRRSLFLLGRSLFLLRRSLFLLRRSLLLPGHSLFLLGRSLPLLSLALVNSWPPR